MLCPNMRATQLYLRQPTPVVIDPVVKCLLVDPRVDLALWRRQSADSAGTYAATSRRGQLEFWREREGPQRARDTFGTEWSWRGEDATLQLDKCNGVVESTEHSNSFERIAGALDARTLSKPRTGLLSERRLQQNAHTP